MRITVKYNDIPHDFTNTFKMYGTKDELLKVSTAIEEQAPEFGENTGTVEINVVLLTFEYNESQFEVTEDFTISGKKLTLLNIAQQIIETATQLEIGWITIEPFEEPVSQSTIDTRVIREIKKGRFFQRIAKILGISY